MIKPLAKFLVGFFIVQFFILIHLKGATGEMRMFDGILDHTRYLNSTIWMKTIAVRLKSFEPVLVYHINFASMLDPKANTEQVTLVNWLALLLVDVIKSFFADLYRGILYRDVIKRIDILRNPCLELIAINFPAGIDYLYTGDSAIMVLFYMSLTVTWIFEVTIAIQMIFACLMDIVPFTAQYKNYIVAASLAVVLILIMFVLNKESFNMNVNWLRVADMLPTLVLMFVFTIFTLWFYGVNNLCEDFHFKVGQPPSVFWKVTLLPLPFFLFLSLLVNYKNAESNIKTSSSKGPPKGRMIYIISIALYTLPFLASFFYEIVHYIKNKKLLALVRAEESWGDPDPEERAARKKYPPKLETKFRRRFDYCKHRCLRYNHVLDQVDEKESDVRAALLNLPQELIQEKDYIYSLIRKLAKE